MFNVQRQLYFSSKIFLSDSSESFELYSEEPENMTTFSGASAAATTTAGRKIAKSNVANGFIVVSAKGSLVIPRPRFAVDAAPRSGQDARPRTAVDGSLQKESIW